jgi:hypothetical protein
MTDAAFSGDWSRIGFISRETEDFLKGCVVAVGCFHIFCAPIAAKEAQRKGLPVAPAVAKVRPCSLEWIGE